MATEKQTIWTRLAGGQLPSMDINTDVTINQGSVIKTAAIGFVVVVLITLAYFAIRKEFTA